MKSLILILVFFSLIACSGIGRKVSSDSPNNEKINEGDNLLVGLDPGKVKVCLSLASMARSAVFNKEKGLSKAEMLAPLPTKAVLNSYPENRNIQKMMGLGMHEILHQVFDYEVLNSEIYSAYTAESCLRKIKGVSVPENFSAVHKELQSCNVQESEKKKILCAMAVAGSKH